MIKKLDQYFIKEFYFVFFCLVLMLFPTLILSDCINGDFNLSLSLSRIICRYCRLLDILLLLSAFITVRMILYKNSMLSFINLGCSKLIGLKVIFIVYLFSIFLYYIIILPSNDFMFNEKFQKTDWNIDYLNNDKKTTFFIHKTKEKKCELWIYDQKLKQVALKSNKMEDYDYSYIWIEPRNMSFATLNQYNSYLKEKNCDITDVIKQKYIYLSKFFLFFVILLFGYTAALNNNKFLLLFCIFLSNWLDGISFFLSLKYCIILICLNILIFLFLSIYLLL